MNVELSFCELRCKEVINIQDGRRLGRIIDVVFDMRGKIIGLVTPGCRRLFRASDDVFIPWCDINKIGDDVILVKLGAHCAHCGGRGCDKCRDKKHCTHCGGIGCEHCRQHHGCPCGGKGCERCNREKFCDQASRFAGEWVYHRFKKGCSVCGGSGCDRCVVKKQEKSAPQEKPKTPDINQSYAEYYNRYDDRSEGNDY